MSQLCRSGVISRIPSEVSLCRREEF
jgi:hypothetical protein